MVTAGNSVSGMGEPWPIRLLQSMRTLRARVALALLPTVFCLLTILTLIQSVRDQRLFLAAHQDKSVAVATSLAEYVGREGLARSERVRSLIRSSVWTTKGVRHVRVIDRGYRVIAASNPRNTGKLYRDPEVLEPVEHGVPAVTISSSIWAPVMRVIAPVRQGSRLVGALEVEFALPASEAGLWPFVRRAMPVSLLVTGVLTLVLLWPLMLVVVRPITRYARVSQDLERGDLSVEIPNQSGEEIGQLGRILAKTRDSLRELSNARTRELSKVWKDQNPLSGLPGNQAIQRELRRRLESGAGFVTLYADLDSLKAFNKRYGLDRGDQVIRFAARALQETVRACGGPDDFLGHVGGGDFVLVVDPDRADVVARAAIEQFEAGVLELYDQEDLERGFITANDRQSGLGQLPLAGLTIVGVPVAARYPNIFKMDEAAAELKAQAKRQPGSKFIMEHVGVTHSEPFAPARIPEEEVEEHPAQKR